MNVQNYEGRQHRTVAVIDFTAANGDFAERANRLTQSLNGDNIKADIVSIHGGAIVAGFHPTYEGESDGNDDAIVAWAREQGYKQVLISRST